MNAAAAMHICVLAFVWTYVLNSLEYVSGFGGVSYGKVDVSLLEGLPNYFA